MTLRGLRRFALVGLPVVVLLGLVAPAVAQHKGEPDKFDFYLLNLSWSPEFCAIQGTSPQCAAHPGFVVHGLWPQNYDGSYPVFCSERSGPASPEKNLISLRTLRCYSMSGASMGPARRCRRMSFLRLSIRRFMR